MDKISVTLGICARNCEDSIRETIDSILEQDFPIDMMEVIFVDDGSKDQTYHLITDHASKFRSKVKIFRNEWKGLGTARQTIVDNAEGDYIIWVDCGLRLAQGYVRKQVEFMNSNPNVGIAKGKHGTSSEMSLSALLEDAGDFAYFQRDTGSFENGGVETSKLPGTGGSIFRTEAVRKVGGFDNRIREACEDTDVSYRVRKAGWTICVTDAVFFKDRESSLRSLLNRYSRYGYGLHYVVHKHSYREIFYLHKMVPLAGLLEGLLLSRIAYKSLRDKRVFLLPIDYFLRRLAMCYGFTKSHQDSYGHRA